MDADPSRPFKMNAKTAYYIKIILPQWFKHFCSFRVVNIDLLLAVPVPHKSPLLRSSAWPVQVQYPCGYSWREDQRSPMKCDLCGSSRLERRTASVSAGRDRYGCEILLRRIKSPFWRVPRWNQPVDLFYWLQRSAPKQPFSIIWEGYWNYSAEAKGPQLRIKHESPPRLLEEIGSVVAVFNRSSSMNEIK